MSRRCWTCNTEHDLDEACTTSMRGRTVTAAGGRLADDLTERPGPVITARFPGSDACCGEGIEAGDRIRADGHGGWIHEGCDDE
ncbi:hypothetical protein [Actinoplanes teichomyceticus]|uniref:Uncharacterized protein n=1 Tax=Actinoplanes teichomyceticus TaxID=1867 RepID=A0A561WAU1_ACTTI|nr:hypothetical protein [Actinoplanes teichomyceticus]TWG20986.1 hypothetical protein FHX34_103515 [Actinoplanes teichomyceticus]GIF14805.1 hypothetical protein Ate01nite_48370 [Actinoplanes teichomyceticus]